MVGEAPLPAKTLAELVTDGTMAVGDGYRAQNEELGSTGPIFLRSAYLQDAGWVLGTPDRLAKPFTSNFGPKTAREGDTVVTTKGNSLGRLGYVQGDIIGAVYSPHLSYWRSLKHELISPRYLFYWASSSQARAQVRARSEATDMAPYLSLRDQLDISVTLPEIGVQKAIAELLGALDDKIELNRQMAKTLEVSARGLFKSWFVDFDPVRAKAERRPTGLADELAALFLDRFTGEGLPEGWTNKSLSSIGRFLNGLALQKFATKAGEPSLPVIKIAELRSGPTAKSGRARADLPADYVVDDGDHLFSWSGSLTHVRWSYGPGALNQHLFKVTPLGVPAWLTFQAVEEHLLEFQAIASGKAVTMGHIQRHHLDEAKVAIPDERLLTALDQVMAPLHERTLGLAVQSRSLAALRETLLPKLISGALRIRDAEREVAAA